MVGLRINFLSSGAKLVGVYSPLDNSAACQYTFSSIHKDGRTINSSFQRIGQRRTDEIERNLFSSIYSRGMDSTYKALQFSPYPNSKSYKNQVHLSILLHTYRIVPLPPSLPISIRLSRCYAGRSSVTS